MDHNDRLRAAIRSRRLLVDADDVTVDYIPALRDFCNAELGMNLSGFPGSFDMSGWMGVTKERMLEIIAIFNETSEEFGRLQAVPHSRESLEALKAMGYEISVLTSATGTPSRIVKRQDNLDRLYGVDMFVEMICIPVGASKAEHLAKIRPSVWLEDNEKNAFMGVEYGHAPLLMPTFHNLLGGRSGHPEVRRVTGWREVACILSGGEEISRIVSPVIRETGAPFISLLSERDVRITGHVKCRSLRVLSGYSLQMDEGASLQCDFLHVAGEVTGAGAITVRKDAFVEKMTGASLSADTAWVAHLDHDVLSRIEAEHLFARVERSALLESEPPHEISAMEM